MNSISWHLFIGMFPFFALFIGVLLFFFALFQQNKTLQITSLFLFLLTSVSLGWLYFTGEKTAFSLKDYPGIHLEWRDEHEMWAGMSMGSAGVLLFFSLIFFIKILFSNNAKEATETNALDKKSIRIWSFVVFLIACLTLCSVTITSYYGMQMRHQEIEAQPKFWY